MSIARCGACLTLLFLGVDLARPSIADERRLSPQQVRSVAVDQPASWPAGDWSPVPRAALEEYLAQPATATAAPALQLKQAEYVARFEPGVLRGTCQFEIPTIAEQQTGGSELVLTPQSLIWSDVRWGGVAAVWGTRADGMTVLQAAPSSTSGSAHWELAGVKVFDGWEFELVFPTAGWSRFSLDVPREYQVATTSGVLEGPRPAEDPEWRRWTLHAGRRTALRLTIAPAAVGGGDAAPLFRAVHQATLRSAGVDLNCEYELVGGAAPAVLRLELPEGLQVVSASAAADIRVPFRVREEGPRRMVLVEWPSTVRDSRVRLRCMASADWASRALVPLPLPKQEHGELLDQQVTLYLRSPLELQRFELDGYRLTDRRSDAEQIESWTFQALRPQPQLVLQVASPPVDLRAELAIWADYQSAVGRIRSRLRVQCQGGSTFALRLACPVDWEVASVSPAVGSALQVTDYYMTPSRTPGERELTVELTQPLSAGAQADLIIHAVCTVPRLGASVALPHWRCLDAATTTGLLAVLPPHRSDVASSLPSLATAPDGEWITWLDSLTDGAQLGDAQLFDLQSIASQPSGGGFSFEASATERDPMVEQPPSGPLDAEPPSGVVGASPEFAGLKLTTRLAAAERREHHHTARYELQQDFDGVVRFRLTPECRDVELLLDGRGCELLAHAGEWLTPQPMTALKFIEIRYRTPATNDFWPSAEAIAAPGWNHAPRIPLDWTIQPEESRCCSEVAVPFARVTERRSPAWSERLFGPLARRERASAPQETAAETRNAAGLPLLPHSPDSGGVLRVLAAETPERLAFRTYNPAASERAAWAVLMLTLLIGAQLRRMRWFLGRCLYPFAWTGLLTATMLADDDWVRILGGSLVGLTLTALLPRRMLVAWPGASSMAASAPERRLHPASVATARLVLWGGCLGCGCSVGWAQLGSPLTGGSDPAAASAVEVLLPDQDGEPSPKAFVSPRVLAEFQAWSARQPTPTSWMIRTAECDVSLGVDADITARFEVLVRDGDAAVPIRLPLQGVTFSSSNAVTIDGEPAAIYPATQGEAIVILVSPASTSDPSSAAHSEWSPHSIEVRCRSSVRSEANRQLLEFQLPIVPSLGVRCAAPASVLSTLRIGGRAATSPADSEGRITVQLDGRHPVVLDWKPAGTASPDPAPVASPALAALTVLDVAPLGVAGRTGVELPWNEGSPSSRWTIPLAAPVLVSGVEAPASIRWRVRPGAQGPALDLTVVEPLTASPTIVISTLQAFDRTQHPGPWVPLPHVIRGGATVREWLSVRAAAGYRVALQRDGAPVIPAVQWPAELPESLRGDFAAGPLGWLPLAAEENLSLNLQAEATERRYTTDCRLTIGRSQAAWSADVVIDVAGAPTPIHRLQLDADVKVDSVKASVDGADRLARYVRQGDAIELILSRPFSGPLRIAVSGTRLVEGDEPAAIPQLQVVEGGVQSSIYQLRNDSGWGVEVVRAAAERPQTLPGSGAALDFTDADLDPPRVFRLIPGPDAVVADVLVQMVGSERLGWQQRVFVDVRPQGIPLRELRIDVPLQMQAGLRVLPPPDQSASIAAGWRQLVFHPNRLRGGTYRVVLQSDLEQHTPDRTWEYQPIRIASAETERRMLILPEEFPLRPTSAAAAVMTSPVPLRLERLLRRTERSLAFEVAAEAVTWMFTTDWRDEQELSVPLLETVLWWDPALGLRGRTVVTAAGTRPSRLGLTMPAGAEVQHVQISGRSPAWSVSAGVLSLDQPTPLADELLSIDWSVSTPPHPGQDVPLPQWSSAVQPTHLVALTPTAGSRLTINTPTDWLQATLAKMSALLTAAELQSTQTFELDSPLLESIRQSNGRLEPVLRDRAADDPQRRTFDELQRRWSRVHQLIAVEAAAPESQSAISSRRGADPWNASAFDADVQVAIVDAAGSRLAFERAPVDPSAPLWGATCLVAVGCGWLLQRGSRWERFADWLAERPALVSFTLGVLWIVWLQPRAVGVVLTLAGLAIWSRRRAPLAHEVDTALVGPGR